MFTLNERMKFLGIMWFMAGVDKGEYANYWGEQIEDAIFETTTSNLDNVMTLSCSVKHFAFDAQVPSSTNSTVG